ELARFPDITTPDWVTSRERMAQNRPVDPRFGLLDNIGLGLYGRIAGTNDEVWMRLIGWTPFDIRAPQQGACGERPGYRQDRALRHRCIAFVNSVDQPVSAEQQ